MEKHLPEIKIYYLSNWPNPCIHICFDIDNQTNWNTLQLKKSKKNRCLYKTSINHNGEMIFVFCNEDKSQWDNPNSDICNPKMRFRKEKTSPYNYFLNHVDTYIVYDSQIKVLKKSQCKSNNPIILFTDLDNTLINHDDIRQEQLFKNFWIDNCLFNKNFKLVYSTGRGLKSFLNLQNTNNLLFPDFLILGCGTHIYDTKQFSKLQEKEGLVDNPDWPIEIGQNWEPFIIQDYIQNNIKWLKQNKVEESDYYRVCYIAKINDLEQNQEDLKTFVKYIFKQHNILTKFIISGSGSHRFIDILPIKADKGSSLKFICNTILNVETKYAVAFGDSLNDVDLLSNAGKAILVGNLQDDLRKWYQANINSYKNMEISPMQFSQAHIYYLQQFF